MSNLKNDILALNSGEPGTTGREPFEDGSARNPNAEFSSTGTLDGTGITGGQGLHHQGEHTHHSGLGGAAAGVATGGVVHGQEHGQGHHSGHGLGEGRHTGSGLGEGQHHTGSGLGEGRHTGAGLGEGHHSGHGVGEGRHTGSGVGEKLTGGYGQGLGDNSGSNVAGRDTGRVGHLDQEAHRYEQTGVSGPTTHGAAGTDRFDTDRTHGAGIGNTREGAPGDINERAHDKGTGGIGGVFTTTDKEFTGRDRLGGASGAYGDEAGHFKANTSGPAGNTALTGREGTQENNPVYHAKSRAGEDVNDVHGANAPGAGSTAHPEHKEGIVEKIKSAFTN